MVGPYDDPDWPVDWVSVDPPLVRKDSLITVYLKVPPESQCCLQYVCATGISYSTFRFKDVVADADGNAVLSLQMTSHFSSGDAKLELTNIKTDDTRITVTYPMPTQYP